MQQARSQYSAARPESPTATLSSIRRDAASVINGTSVPSEAQVNELLERMYSFAELIVFGDEGGRRAEKEEADIEATARSSTSQETDTSSALLDDLSEDTNAHTNAQDTVKVSYRSNMSLAFRTKSAETLCEVVYYLMRDPKVNIDQSMINLYTRIQCLLGKPEYLPEIFDLLAYKPAASQSGSTVKYTPRKPWRRSAAIPLELASAALATAINKRDMGLAVAITDTTVSTPAHRLQRFLTKAAPTLSLLTIIPFTAYTAATWASTYQDTFEPEMAKMMALAGSTAYIGTFGTIAYIAKTTWSDHHDRVHWQVGKTLYKRWLEDDERAFLDRIAQAWGFEDRKRRGEEQGEEWEALRDTIGLRGMVLDKTEFLEGMQ